MAIDVESDGNPIIEDTDDFAHQRFCETNLHTWRAEIDAQNRKSKWKRIGDRCCHRTPYGCALYLLFYISFYSGLAFFFAIMMYGLYATLDMHVPKYILEESLIGSPGLSVRPSIPPVERHVMVSKYNHKLIIKYDPLDLNTSTSHIASINKFISKYEDIDSNKTKESYIDCEGNSMLENNTLCLFNISSLGPYCTSENHWGYDTTSPCVILKLNKVFGWVPEVSKNVSEAQVPNEALSEALNRNVRNDSAEMIWIWCRVNNHNVSIDYYPYPGYPTYFYPFTNQEGYLAPIIGLHIKNIPNGVHVKVSCRTYVKNIDHDFITGAGTVKFTMHLK